MLEVNIKSIPHTEQRYETCGDWWWENGTLYVRVSELSDWRHEFLVALHELVEAMLCKDEGVSQVVVDAFDQRFEDTRPEGNTDEPGDCYDAPYYREHQVASGIERLVAAELLLDWQEYERDIEGLGGTEE